MIRLGTTILLAMFLTPAHVWTLLMQTGQRRNRHTGTHCPQKEVRHLLTEIWIQCPVSPLFQDSRFGSDSPDEIRAWLVRFVCLGFVCGVLFGFAALGLVLVPGSYLLGNPIWFNQGDLCLSAHTAPPPAQKKSSWNQRVGITTVFQPRKSDPRVCHDSNW